MFSRLSVFRIIRQIGIILTIAVFAGILTNYIRHDSLPLPGEWYKGAIVTLDDGTNIAISIEEAKNHFLSQSAVFIDARSLKNFQSGHIKGAISFPWMAFDEFVEKRLPQLPENKVLITYCEGETCKLSKDLALALIELGFYNTRVLVNGWDIWKENKLPVTHNPNNDPDVR